MRKTLLILFVFSLTNTFGQTYSSVINDKEIYDFLNWVTKNEKKYSEEPFLKKKQISCEILKWNIGNFLLEDSLIYKNNPKLIDWNSKYLYKYKEGTDTIFSEKDRLSILEQFNSIKDSIWHKKFKKSKLLESKDQSRYNRYYYSVPLFSKNKNYVIIQLVYYCGDECAYGGYYVYKKISNKKWKFVISVNTWMS